MKKFTSVVSVVLLSLMLLSSCASEYTASDFTQNELTITLDSSFVKGSADGYTACYSSFVSNVKVYLLREEFSLFEDPDDITFSDYAALVLQNNKDINASVTSEESYAWFEYTDIINEVEYSYFVCLYKGSEAFWMLQFISPSSLYGTSRTNFVRWAESIRFRKVESTE